MRILVLLNFVPYPLTSGAQLRAYHLIRRMAARHEVWLGIHVRSQADVEHTTPLRAFCEDVVVGWVRQAHPLAHVPGLLRYAAEGKPLELKFKWSEELATRVPALCEAVPFDVVLFEESTMAPYLECLPAGSHRKHVLTFYDVDFLQARRIAQVAQPGMLMVRAWLYALMAQRWEPRVAERFDCCITVSDVDRHHLLEANPCLSHVAIVPNGVDTKAYHPLPEANGPPVLMFIGSMDYAPCVDAVRYFHDAIWPVIRSAVPAVQWWIVGRNPGPEIAALEGDGIHVTGQVAEVTPYYQRSTACIVPLRSGGGTRLKILEAMALGRAVVSTSIGCEGLEITAGEHLLVADEPVEFAECVLRLIHAPALRERLVTDARARVEALYGWDQIAESQLALLERLLDRGMVEEAHDG